MCIFACSLTLNDTSLFEYQSRLKSLDITGNFWFRLDGNFNINRLYVCLYVYLLIRLFTSTYVRVLGLFVCTSIICQLPINNIMTFDYEVWTTVFKRGAKDNRVTVKLID